MNLNYLFRQIKKRKELKHYEIKPIGSTLKIKRKQMGMTLEEGAAGICSISYLSKLENNQIEPNLDFVDQLVERFDIKEQLTFDDYQYEKDFNELCFLAINLEKPERGYSEYYIEREDHQACMIRLLESALLDKYENISSDMKTLIQFIPHLKQTELTMVLLSLCGDLLKSERYLDAYRVVSELPLSREEINMYSILTLRMRLILSFLMHKFTEIDLYYQIYMNEVSIHGYDHLARELKLYKLVHLSYYQQPHIIQHMEILLDRNHVLEHLPYAISCFSNGRYDKVIEMSRLRNDLSGWLIIYLLSLEHKNEIDEMKYLIENKIPKKMLPSEGILLNHIKTKYFDEPKQLLFYLRREVLGNRISIDHPLLLEYLVLDSAKAFQKSQFYKEASTILSMYHSRFISLRTA